MRSLRLQRPLLLQASLTEGMAEGQAAWQYSMQSRGIHSHLVIVEFEVRHAEDARDVVRGRCALLPARRRVVVRVVQRALHWLIRQRLPQPQLTQRKQNAASG